jgi:hypothetical protein
MPGFGAERAELRERSGSKRLKTMTIHMPSHEDPKAGHVVEHEHHPPHGAEHFTFGNKEHEALAAHLEKHLGIKLPGKAAGAEGSAESAEPKSDFQ